MEDRTVGCGDVQNQGLRCYCMDRNELIESFVPLARSIASRHAYGVPGLECEDLEQEAMVGVVKAVDRYDKSKGVPAAAYVAMKARWEVLSAIRRERGKGRSEVEVSGWGGFFTMEAADCGNLAELVESIEAALDADGREMLKFIAEGRGVREASRIKGWGMKKASGILEEVREAARKEMSGSL